ncbi:MAG: prolyl oligopeptidase family serine peptidase [Fimbriimonadaceae bacterium]
MLPLLVGVLTSSGPFPLTVESIMRGPALVGHAPRRLQWSADGTQIGFTWAKTDGSKDPAYKSYVVKADGSGLAEGALPRETPPNRNAWDGGSKSGSKTIYEEGGDLWVYDSISKETKRTLETPEREREPRFVSGSSDIVFIRSDNVWKLTSDGKTVQLTDIRLDSSKDDPTVPGAAKVVAPPNFRKSLSLSPDGRVAIVAMQENQKEDRQSMVPTYVTSSGYSELIPTYPKVGGPQTETKIKTIDLANGASADLDFPKRGRMGQFRWSPDGKFGVAWAFSEDSEDGWLYSLETAKNSAKIIWTEHNDAWIGGPGRGLLGWLPDSSRVYFSSENKGFANLMTVEPSGDNPKNLIGGAFEVSEVQLDEPRNRFIFVSSEKGPSFREICSVPLEGGPRTKLADYSADEDAEFAMSPDGKEFAIVRSSSNRPAELFIRGKQVTVTPTEEWLAGPWIDPPIVMVPARDGTPVPARMYKPKRWKKGGPAVIFVHGAGYLQNVYSGWSHYYREYMFHHLLMEKGYMVLDMDYRGSAGYGSAWRTAIYRHMGGTDLTDHVDGAAWLVKEHGVDAKRLGIYGGSYGGFITFMAMFTTPDVFAAGAALRPVADWTNYNHGYTAPILNTPSEDKIAYERSSPINFVSGLKGALLICHGMVDVNVQFQDSVRVVQKLIELGKTNWWVAPYPVEDHAFTRPESWTDEYRRILELFENTIGSNRKK